jgi:altronate hydrolase
MNLNRRFMEKRFLRIHPQDNAAVALVDLHRGDQVDLLDIACVLPADVPAKHRFALHALAPGEPLIQYGTLIGRAAVAIDKGELLSTRNTRHETSSFRPKSVDYVWRAPSVSHWEQRRFLGFARADGQVGTRNYWLVIPMVFCENRNVAVLKQALEEELGFAPATKYRREVSALVRLFREGKLNEIRNSTIEIADDRSNRHSVFENFDGVKFLLHTGGCGGTREDARALCGLLAGYIHHPNIAGATVLSLGCQNAQVEILCEELAARNPAFAKPLLILEQQKSGTESSMLSRALRETFLGIVEANKTGRSPAPLSHLTVGLKCGGSDGFSGISANPAIGHLADLISALQGKALLAEFPELCGVEQSLIDRCVRKQDEERFVHLMRTYAERARAVGSGFDMNPSPGNIRDGLITDALKSAGAAKKGGTSPITAVLDYPEYVATAGLNLLCTPGNDVEAVTAEVGAGANIVLFTTGLGTPTGNPVAPVVKLSTNTALAQHMPDIIDIDTGAVIRGEKSIEEMGEEILDRIIPIASGELHTKAELLGQDDFIPWKRGISL